MWRFNININMALPTTGPISLGQIQTEFGGSNPISLSEYYAGPTTYSPKRQWANGYGYFKQINITRNDGVWQKFDLSSSYAIDFEKLQIIGGGGEIIVTVANNSSGSNPIELCRFGNNDGGEGSLKTITGITNKTIWVKIALTDPGTYGAYIKVGIADDTNSSTVSLKYVQSNNGGKIPSSGINKLSNYRGGGGALGGSGTGVEFIMVGGGGGGGGGEDGGGGGGGGWVHLLDQLVTTPLSVVVGQGGTAGSTTRKGGDGTNSSIGAIIARGGGGGGTHDTTKLISKAGTNIKTIFKEAAGNGGSGGGGAGGASGTGVVGQGFNGIENAGGGAGGVGDPEVERCGKGGCQVVSPLKPGVGILWNGKEYGAGGHSSKKAVVANSGEGGGLTKAGATGVVIIGYPGTVAKASGGTVTTSGGYVYHTFTANGTFTP